MHDCDTSAHTGRSDTSGLRFPGCLSGGTQGATDLQPGSRVEFKTFRRQQGSSDAPGCVKDQVFVERAKRNNLRHFFELLPPTPEATPWPSQDFSMTVNTVVTPSMTSSNSMSSGYCSLDDESEDFTFFTAKTSFFRRPKQAAKVQKWGGSHRRAA